VGARESAAVLATDPTLMQVVLIALIDLMQVTIR
jgi:hypothetical protein